MSNLKTRIKLNLDITVNGETKKVQVIGIVQPPFGHLDFLRGAKAWARLLRLNDPSLQLSDPSTKEEAYRVYEAIAQQTELPLVFDGETTFLQTEEGTWLELPDSVLPKEEKE